jgi:hypothetical protein
MAENNQPIPISSQLVYLTKTAQFDSSYQILGECYAYHYEDLKAQAESENTSIHILLLHRLIAGLWDASHKSFIFAFYEAFTDIDRLFLCSPRKFGNAFFNCVHPKLSNIVGYIESGYACTKLQNIRPLVTWEPPCTMIALWPKGQTGETKGRRVIDTGTLLGYYSYEDEAGYQRIQDGDLMNPDYLCVPFEPEITFQLNGKAYRYSNRFCSLEP